MFHPVDGFDDALHLVPECHRDRRGSFHEWFKASSFEEAMGFPFDLQQANLSVSAPGVIRGLHLAQTPPGQAKLVVCPKGRIVDVLVDVREGSPTFGSWRGFELSADNGEGLYVPVGFAHGFVALEESVVVYLTTSEYQPGVEYGFDPFDPQVGVEWPRPKVEEVEPGDTGYILSEKDQAAPSLAELGAQGLLPSFQECREYAEELRAGWRDAADAGL